MRRSGRSTHIAQNPSNVNPRRVPPDVSSKNQSTDRFGITDGVECSMRNDWQGVSRRGGTFDEDARSRGSRKLGSLALEYCRKLPHRLDHRLETIHGGSQLGRWCILKILTAVWETSAGATRLQTTDSLEQLVGQRACHLLSLGHARTTLHTHPISPAPPPPPDPSWTHRTHEIARQLPRPARQTRYGAPPSLPLLLEPHRLNIPLKLELPV